MIFHFFLVEKSKKKIFFSCTDTATIYCSKSFDKQSVTSRFAGMRFFCFRSIFEGAKVRLGTQNLTPAAMLPVGVQRELPRRGGGEGDVEVIARVLPIELQHLHPLPFQPHLFTHTYTHIHTHTHTHTLSLSLSHTH